MAERGAPEGNENARQGRRWREALQRALAREGSSVESGLDQCATALVKAAMAGKPWALEHIAERMDGKATQVVHATVEHTVSTGDSASLEQRLQHSLSARTEHTVQ